MSDKNTLMQEIEAVVGEVQELLKKSGMALHKDGPEELTPPSADPSAAPAAPAPEAPAPDAIGDQAAEAPEMGSPEGGAPQEAGEAELGHAAQESEGDLASEAKGLSDEELDGLLQVLMAEKESRKAPEQANAPMEAPGAAPEMPPAEKSMKEDFAKMTKSFTEALESINKKVDALAAKPAPVAPKVTAKAPAMNSQDVQVLHKSTPVAKRLSKSETESFLMSELRKGNKSVNSEVMHSITVTKSDDELHAAQDSLKKSGIIFPTV